MDIYRTGRIYCDGEFVFYDMTARSITMSCDLLERLHALRTDLVDLAFALERRGQMEAADVAIATSARLQELCDESADRQNSPQPVRFLPAGVSVSPIQ